MAVTYTMKKRKEDGSEDPDNLQQTRTISERKRLASLEDEASFRAIRDAAYDESRDKQFQKDAGSKKNKRKGKKLLDDLLGRA